MTPSVTHLLNTLNIAKETKERSDNELAKLTEAEAVAFVTEQYKLTLVAMYVGCTAQVNIGKTLHIWKKRIPHGDFRPWAQKRFKLPQSTITHCMKLADTARKHHINPATMSGRAVLRLEDHRPQMDKDTIRKEQEKRPIADRRRGEFEVLADRIEQALQDDKAIFGEVLVPRLRKALKEYGKTAERQKAVRE